MRKYTDNIIKGLIIMDIAISNPVIPRLDRESGKPLDARLGLRA